MISKRFKRTVQQVFGGRSRSPKRPVMRITGVVKSGNIPTHIITFDFYEYYLRLHESLLVAFARMALRDIEDEGYLGDLDEIAVALNFSAGVAQDTLAYLQRQFNADESAKYEWLVWVYLNLHSQIQEELKNASID